LQSVQSSWSCFAPNDQDGLSRGEVEIVKERIPGAKTNFVSCNSPKSNSFLKLTVEDQFDIDLSTFYKSERLLKKIRKYFAKVRRFDTNGKSFPD
jgi:hypothetical protein